MISISWLESDTFLPILRFCIDFWNLWNHLRDQRVYLKTSLLTVRDQKTLVNESSLSAYNILFTSEHILWTLPKEPHWFSSLILPFDKFNNLLTVCNICSSVCSFGELHLEFSNLYLLVKFYWVISFYIYLLLLPEKAMAPHSSTLAWKIPWTEEPGGLQSMGSLRVGHDWALHFHFSLSCTGEGNGNPLQCSCLENPRDRGA